MRQHLVSAAILAALALATTGMTAQSKPAPPVSAPVIVMEMAGGVIEIELHPAEAPKSVAHILMLVRRDFYRGLRFHWVQPGVVQVGDPLTRNMAQQSNWGKGNSGSPIGVAEISKRPWDRGTVGLYFLFNDPTQADSQFFINRVPNSALVGKYTMIGHVTKGLDVLDKIERSDIVKVIRVKGDPVHEP